MACCAPRTHKVDALRTLARRVFQKGQQRRIELPATASWAHRGHICTRTGLTAATSAPGPSSLVPRLRRDWRASSNDRAGWDHGGSALLWGGPAVCRCCMHAKAPIQARATAGQVCERSRCSLAAATCVNACLRALRALCQSVGWRRRNAPFPSAGGSARRSAEDGGPRPRSNERGRLNHACGRTPLRSAMAAADPTYADPA